MKSTVLAARTSRIRARAGEGTLPATETRAEPAVEQYLRAVVDASCALLDADVSAGLRKAIEIIGKETGLDRVYVSRFNHEQAAGYFECERCAPGIATVAESRGVGPYSYRDYEEVWRPLMAGRIYSSATREKTGANSELNNALGTQRDLFLPIFVQGEFWGCIGFDNCTSDRPFSAAEIQVLRGAANAIEAALARDSAERTRLRETKMNETRIQRWLDVSGEGAWGARLEPPVDVSLPIPAQVAAIIAGSVLTECNDYGARSMGYRDAADWIGRRANEFFPANEVNVAYLSAFIQAGYDLREAESQDGAPDGEQRWFLNNLCGIVTDGHLVALYGTHRDISALKRTEVALLASEQDRRREAEASNAELRGREALLQTVAEASRTLLAGADFDAAVNTTLRMLGTALDIDRVSLIKDVPGPHADRPGTHWLTHEWHRPELPSQLASPARGGPYPSEAIWRRQVNGETMIMHLDETDDAFAAGQEPLGVKSMLAVSVMLRRGMWGVIVFDDCRRRREWARHDAATLETAAACIAAALESREEQAAAAARRDRYVRLLGAVGDAAAELLATRDIAPCIERVIARVGETSQADRVCLARIDWAGDDPQLHGYQEIVYEWTKPGALRQMDSAERRFAMRRDDAAWVTFFRDLNQSGHLLVRIADAEEPFRSEQAALGVVWNLCCPIYVEGKLWGLMGFDYGRPLEDYDTADRSALQTLANSLAAALDREATERRRLAEERTRLEEAMALNRLLEAVVDASRILLEREDFDAALTAWLDTLARTIGADHAMLGTFDAPSIDNVACLNRVWSRESASTMVYPPVPATTDFIAWRAALLRGETIVAHRDELTDPASVRYWEGLNCFADVIVPFRIQDESLGWVSLSWVKRHNITPAHVAVLRTAANGVAAVLKRREANLALHAEREKRLLAKRALLESERARVEASERLTALLQVVVGSSRELLNAPDFEPALLQWLGRFGDAMHATRATFYDIVFHEEAGRNTMRMLVEWVRPGVRGSIPVSFANPHVIDPRGAEIAMDRMTNGQNVVFHTEDATGVAREFLAEQGNASVVAVPLYLDGRQYGCISLDFSIRTEPSPAILAVLQTAADTLASIIARDEAVRTMLAERERAAALRLEARDRSLTVLRTGTATLAGVLDLDRFLPELMRQMIRQIEGWDAQLFLYDPADDTLRPTIGVSREETILAAPGLFRDLPISQRFPANITDAWRRMLESRSVVFFDTQLDAGDYWPGVLDWFRERHYSGSVAIALMVGDEPLGLLGFMCQGKPAVGAEELNMLETLAEQASLAIAMSRLAEQARSAAVARERQQAAQERAEELETVNRALRTAVSDLVSIGDLNAFLSGLLRQSLHTVNAQTGAIALITGHRVEHVVVIDGDGIMDEERKRRDGLLHVDYDGHLRAFAEDMNRRDISCSINPEVVEMPPAFRAYHRRVGNREIRLVPLRAGSRLLGWMGLGFAADSEPSVDKLALLRGLADQMALAVELTRLASVEKNAAVTREREEASQRRITELAAAHGTLRQATAGLVADAEIGRFLCALLTQAAAITTAKTAGIFTYDESNGRMRMFALMTGGQEVDLEADPRMIVWRNDVPAFISERWTEQLRNRDFASFDNHAAGENHPWPISRDWHAAMGHRYVITVPLFAGKRLIGTFGQCFPDGYDVTTFDFGMTRVLANHAALALHMMQLSREARESATAAAVLKERNRIARDLHDTLAQGFAGVIAQLGAAEGSLDLEQPSGARAYVERAKALARRSLSEARTSVHALRPSADPVPITSRLQQLTQGMTQGLDLTCSVKESGTPWMLSPALDWCAYKFVQEALANTMKHSGATAFDLVLQWSEQTLHVSASDNGCGVSGGPPARGLGMIAMAERASEVAGRFHWESGMTGGLIVSLELPRTGFSLE